MARSVLSLFILVSMFLSPSLRAQETSTYKSFNKYAGLVKGIDFFASKKQSATPFQEPLQQVIARLEALLGDPLPKGSIFISSTQEQKDSIYEPMILKMGYAWTLSVESPEIRAQAMMERMRSMMGDDIPAEIRDRMRNMQPSTMDNRATEDTARKVAYAIIQTSFAKNLKYRSSRLNDMGKSPLPDWLDIGIGAYATGQDPNINYLKQNMEQTFSIEDVLTMSRPFVASTFLQGDSSGNGRGGFGGGQGFPPGGFSGAGGEGGSQGGFNGGQGFPPGGFGGANGGGQGFPPGGFGGMNGGGQGRQGNGGRQGGGSQRTIPKDEQDQMIFDGESSTFFAFLLEKIGMEKMKALIASVREDNSGTGARKYVTRPDMLGEDYSKIETQWIDYVQNLKSEPSFSRSGMPQAKQDN
jgi:hypothetical protein